MTQTIEQLTARVRELEEFKANVVKECASIIKHAHKDITKQLAASQAYAEQLRVAHQQIVEVANDMTRHGNIVFRDMTKIAEAALAIPHSTIKGREAK